MAAVSDRSELNKALEVIESTNLKYFTKDMIPEFFALKGLLLAHIGKSEEANKAFSAAVQMTANDQLVKSWALWGDYLEAIFIKNPKQINLGVSAMICFLRACRHQNESKSRKYLAKVIWLLSYDDDKSEENKMKLMETLDTYQNGVPPLQWLPWIPQLLCCLVQYETEVILNLLSQIGRMFPQAVYFPIRTLYLTLKVEQRERLKNAEQAKKQGESSSQEVLSDQQQQNQGAAGQQAQPGPQIKATKPMWRCSKIMYSLRDIHPTVLSSLEGIVDQMVWFRENWYEEVFRQLRQALTKCYAIAFENRGAVNEAVITPHIKNFMEKLISTFGIGIENISNSASNTTNYSSAASESLARRAQATIQDPVFQKMKEQFTTDFDFSQPNATKLHNVIANLKIWIKILETRTKQLPK